MAILFQIQKVLYYTSWQNHRMRYKHLPRRLRSDSITFRLLLSSPLVPITSCKFQLIGVNVFEKDCTLYGLLECCTVFMRVLIIQNKLVWHFFVISSCPQNTHNTPVWSRFNCKMVKVAKNIFVILSRSHCYFRKF